MPNTSASETLHVQDGKPVTLPSGETVANAAFARDGADLMLTSPDGGTVRIEGYFSHNPAPDIVTADGGRLSPDMVSAFLPPAHPGAYAAATAPVASDATPVGKVTQVVGSCTITHADGTHAKITPGLVVHQGDVVQTSAKGAVDILFSDNTTFAVSENARLSIDEYTYNSSSHEGTSFFSLLQGVFVYTSGLIGKHDAGAVNIDTPVGSIGIRGTVIAGDINPAGQPSTITVVDGSIVVQNDGGTLQMSTPLDTATVSSYDTAATDTGTMTPQSFTTTYSAAAPVATSTFTAVTSGAVQPPATVVPAPETAPQTAPTDSTTLQQSSLPTGTSTTPTAPSSPTTFSTTTDTTTFTTSTTSLTSTDTTSGTVATAAAPSTTSVVSAAAPATGVATAAAPATSTTPPAFAVTATLNPAFATGTPLAGADSLPILGLGGFGNGTVLATFGTNNADPFTIAVAGTMTGPILQYASSVGDATANGAVGPVLQFNSGTNQLSIANAAGLTGPFSITVTATDTVTGATASMPLTINVGELGSSILIDNHITGGFVTLFPPAAITGEIVTGTASNQTIIGRDTSGDILIAGGSGDILYGEGNSVTFNENSNSNTVMIANPLSSGGDTFIFQNASFLTDSSHVVGAGSGNTLQLGNASGSSQTFDFTLGNPTTTAAPPVTDIQTISMTEALSGSSNNNLVLNFQEIFAMTGSAHTLNVINTQSGSYTTNVDIYSNGATLTYAGANSGLSGPQTMTLGATATETVTMHLASNNETVTLVINPGSTGAANIHLVVH
jgi:hypothetical protein